MRNNKMRNNKKPSSKFTARGLLLVLSVLALAGCDFEVSTNKGGKVLSNPTAINCRHNSGTCVIRDYQRSRLNVSEAQLIAIPDKGYRFSHWAGCDRSERLHCYKNLSGDITIRATFEPLVAASGGASGETLRFVAVGDFGTGDGAQELVGNAMGQVCDQLGGCDFAIGLGDNIYGEAVQSPYADAFVEKFEHPFRNADFPFYMTLGNHDNSLVIDGFGNWNSVGNAQVDYSYRNDRESDRWRMPDRYYRHDHPESAGSPFATFLALDSNPFMTVFELNPEYWVWYEWAQGAWARDALANTNATWKIAYAHHPYLSNGSHGNAGNYDGIPALDPVFTPRFSGENYRKWLQHNVCGKVDMYVAGHDHDMQLLHSVPECGDTILLVSGAGAKTRSLKGNETRNPFWYQKGDALGFAVVTLQDNVMTMQIYEVSELNGSVSESHKQTFKRRQL